MGIVGCPHPATKSMYQAITDSELDELWGIYLGERKYQLTEKIWVIPLTEV